MKIKVKDTYTGQVGTMDDSELSSRYQKVEDIQPTQTTTQPVVQTTQPKTSSIAGSALDFITNLIAPRTKNVVQDIGASNNVSDYESENKERTKRLNEISNQMKIARQEGDNEKGKQLAIEAKKLSSQAVGGELSELSSPEFSIDTQKAVEKGKTGKVTDYLGRGLGVGVELGSLLTPMLAGKMGAVSRIASPVLDTGLKAGAVTGALYGATNPEDTIAERLKGGVVGGITGGATGALLDKITGLKKTGEGIRQGVSKPKVPASPYGAQEEAKIAKGLQDLGIKGSAKSQYSQLGAKMSEIGGQIDDIVKNSTNSIGIDDLTKNIDDSLINMVNYDTTIPGYETAKNKFLNQITKLSEGGKLTTKALVEAKKNLGSQLSNAFTKQAKGTVLTPSEETGMAIWNSLDDVIKAVEPAVKDLTTQQSMLYKGAQGLKANIGKGGIKLPIIGQVGANLGQSTQDVTGRAISSIGSATEKINPTNIAPLLQNILQGQRTTPTETIPTTEITPETTQTTTPTTETAQPTNQFTEQQYKALAMMDMIKTGGKNLTKLQALYKITNPESSISAADQKRKTALDSAEGVYNQVYDLAMSAPTGVKGYVKATVGKLPGVEGGSAEDLSRVTDGLAKAIAGAMAGEVGVATDKDVERWKGLMPKVTDTMEERKRVLERLKKSIDEGRKQFSTPQSTDILQGLTQ